MVCFLYVICKCLHQAVQNSKGAFFFSRVRKIGIHLSMQWQRKGYFFKIKEYMYLSERMNREQAPCGTRSPLWVELSFLLGFQPQWQWVHLLGTIMCSLGKSSFWQMSFSVSGLTQIKNGSLTGALNCSWNSCSFWRCNKYKLKMNVDLTELMTWWWQ